MVISAGPSARNWRDVYEEVGRPKLVVCVKQAIELEAVSGICALHFCNSWNLKKYRYDTSKILRIFSSAHSDPASYQEWDIRYTIQQETPDLRTSLAASGRFADWTIDMTGTVRPWGPGIMYETVFYTLVHLGVSSIATVGWDLGDGSGATPHFYDLHDTAAIVRPDVQRSSSLAKRLISRAGGRHVNQFLRFHTGKNYNIAGALPGEIELVARSVPGLRDWLRTTGIDLSCFSDSPWLSDLSKEP